MTQSQQMCGDYTPAPEFQATSYGLLFRCSPEEAALIENLRRSRASGIVRAVVDVVTLDIIESVERYADRWE